MTEALLSGAGSASTSRSEAAPSKPAICKGAGPPYHHASVEHFSPAAILFVAVRFLCHWSKGLASFTLWLHYEGGHGSGDESLYRDLLRKAGGNRELAGKWLEQIASTAPADADTNGGNVQDSFSETSVGSWSQRFPFPLTEML